jgi:hypothetical protein
VKRNTSLPKIAREPRSIAEQTAGIIYFQASSDAERGIIEVVYQCTACDAIDTERLFADKPTPVALCCVSCKCGFGIELGDMVRRQVGMFPVSGMPLVGGPAK